tara:strand:+ start:1379 stop:2413 length:1035 start_codon:yes stop_codon:yes gene_type:complete
MEQVAGSIRFNTDSSKMEIYNGEQWWEINATSPEEQTGATRGILGGGFTQSGNSNRDVIEFFNVDTTGNCADFGNLTSSRRCQGQGAGSRTRGIFMGGRASPANRDVIDFITIASTGDATDFGNLTDGGASNSGQGGNATRAVCNGGQRGSTGTTKKNIIDFITIASTGDALDFGDSTVSRVTQTGGLNSPTRGVFAGGYTPTQINTIEYITFSTQANAADFGDLTHTVRRAGGGSNAIRGIIMGGNNYDGGHIGLNNIDFITIATLGNSIDFGDMVSADSADTCACAASRTRAAYHRTDTGTTTNTMDYVTIMSTGNALDFGDTNTSDIWGRGGLSNGHGGLG